MLIMLNRRKWNRMRRRAFCSTHWQCRKGGKGQLRKRQRRKGSQSFKDIKNLITYQLIRTQMLNGRNYSNG